MRLSGFMKAVSRYLVGVGKYSLILRGASRNRVKETDQTGTATLEMNLSKESDSHPGFLDQPSKQEVETCLWKKIFPCKTPYLSFVCT